jgi:hypothetical protein
MDLPCMQRRKYTTYVNLGTSAYVSAVADLDEKSRGGNSDEWGQFYYGFEYFPNMFLQI